MTWNDFSDLDFGQTLGPESPVESYQCTHGNPNCTENNPCLDCQDDERSEGHQRRVE